MNSTANGLLSIGASPVMAHAEEEVEDMVSIAGALVINIGTLSDRWIVSMFKAMRAAKEKGIPVVLDPVGAGATPLRTDTCKKMLEQVTPDIVRGNASEIMAILDASVSTKGVDSAHSTKDAEDAAVNLASSFGLVVSVSGETDLITDGSNIEHVKNGHPYMPKITGLGCTATALTGAFAAVNHNYLDAAINAMAVMGVAGELAAENSNGPGTLQPNFLDALYNLNESQLKKYLKT
jgi:hydroxyethylthiazole kinase